MDTYEERSLGLKVSYHEATEEKEEKEKSLQEVRTHLIEVITNTKST